MTENVDSKVLPSRKKSLLYNRPIVLFKDKEQDPITVHTSEPHSTNSSTNSTNSTTNSNTPSFVGVHNRDYDIYRIEKSFVDTFFKTDLSTINGEAKKKLHKEDYFRRPNVHFGQHEMSTLYISPFPTDYIGLQTIYYCEYCLNYFKSRDIYQQHALQCKCTHPVGNEIYRNGELSVFEVDGGAARGYCQSMCLLAKMYLDSKTLYYDVDPFLFYVLARYDNNTGTYRFIGYFSKEKISNQRYNLSCILILPQYRRMGYAQFLIDFSYLLTRKEQLYMNSSENCSDTEYVNGGGCNENNNVELSRNYIAGGAPEKPLSELGRLTYHKYWNNVVAGYLLRALSVHREQKNQGTGEHATITIRDVINFTGMTAGDISETLIRLKCVAYNDSASYENIKAALERLGAAEELDFVRATGDELVVLIDEASLRQTVQPSQIELREEKLKWLPTEYETAE